MSLARIALVGAAVVGYAYLSRYRRNPDFFTDASGVIRPIRSTNDYDQESGGDTRQRDRTKRTDTERDRRRRKQVKGQQKRRTTGYVKHLNERAFNTITDRWLTAGIERAKKDDQIGRADSDDEAGYRTILAFPAIAEEQCLEKALDRVEGGKFTPRQALALCPPASKQQGAAKQLATRWRKGREVQGRYEEEVGRAAIDLSEEESRLEVRDQRKYPYKTPLAGLAWNQIEYLYDLAKDRGELKERVTLEDDGWWNSLDFGDDDPFLTKEERARRRRAVREKKMQAAITQYGRPRTEANLPPAEPDPKTEIKREITAIKRDIRNLDKKYKPRVRTFTRLEKLLGQVQSGKITPAQAVKKAA